jgi:hypothetical protein
VARSTSVIDRGSSSPFGYLGTLGDRFAPWPLAIGVAAVFALADRRRRRQQQPHRPQRLPRTRWFRAGVAPLLGLWIGIPLALFSLARTQHHWYLDPIYPACAMLAAPAILDLVRRTPRQIRGAALIVLVMLPLALCEARVLERIVVRDRMPESQRFLVSLRRRSRLRCRELRAAFPLDHSERFILEVVDGFRVVEERPGRWPAAHAARRHHAPGPWPEQPGACLLVAKRPPPFTGLGGREAGALPLSSSASSGAPASSGASGASGASAAAGRVLIGESASYTLWSAPQGPVAEPGPGASPPG